MFTRPMTFGAQHLTEKMQPVTAVVHEISARSDPWRDPPSSEPEEQAQQFPPDPFERLLEPDEFDAPDVRSESLRLRDARAQANAAVRGFLERRAGQRREKMVEKHEELKAECRAAERDLQRTQAKLTAADRELAGAENAVRRCASATQNLSDERRMTSRFAPAAEIQAIDTKMAQAVDRLRAAESAVGIARQARNLIALEELRRPSAELERLKTLEWRLAGRLSGKPYVDFEFGLTRST